MTIPLWVCVLIAVIGLILSRLLPPIIVKYRYKDYFKDDNPNSWRAIIIAQWEIAFAIIAILLALFFWSISHLSTQINNIGVKVDKVGEKVDKVSEKIDNLGEKIDNLGEKVDKVGKKVDEVGEKVDEVGEKVDGVSKQIEKRYYELKEIIK